MNDPITLAVRDPGPDSLERDIQARASVAPRVTPDDIEAEIMETHYFTAEAALDAVRLQWLMEDHADPAERQAARDVAGRLGVMGEYSGRRDIDIAMGRDGNGWSKSLGLLTICVLVLRNGFTATGESACASPENFNAEIGRRIARENAVAKIWPLLGFRLRDKLQARSGCQGERCMSTDGSGHSRECIAEAGRNQGWTPTAEELAAAGPSAPRITEA